MIIGTCDKGQSPVTRACYYAAAAILIANGIEVKY